ncbi:hypothetical protein IJD44_00310 [bacterium]|nr:hypothetical protein [bacterium]
MQLGRISLHTTKALQANTQQNTANTNKLSTNPFGVSFKGNVIQADVFQSAKKAAEKVSVMQRGKLFASAVVGGINSFNEAFKTRMNNIVSFGKKFTADVIEKLDRIGSTEISFDMSGIANRLFPDRQYSVKNLSTKSVDELKAMWQGIGQLA